MKKVIYAKTLNFQNNESRCKIEIELRQATECIELSIVGDVYSPMVKSFGQCQDSIKTIFSKNKKVHRICEVWDRYHLNTFHAGCEHQREFEKEPYENHANDYCPICNYKYGHGWKYEVIPNEIIEEIKSW